MSHDNSTQKKKKSPEEKHLDAVNGHAHHFVADYDGGKCLWGGVYVYKVHSCSYRYQAIGRAKEDNLVYDWPAYKEALGNEKIQAGRRTKKGGWYPKRYGPEIDAPTEAGKQWDLTGDNFQYSTKPYWNQPHHIIPIGLFRDRLSDLGKDLRPGLESEAERSLLAVGYNINHKINMILLPMDNAVSVFLRLPKHGGPDGKNNHEEYDRVMRLQLDKIMNLYREKFSELGPEEHLSEVDSQAQKLRLEGLSKRMYRQITCDCPRDQPAEAYEGDKSLESEALKYKANMEKAMRVVAGRVGGGS